MGWSARVHGAAVDDVIEAVTRLGSPWTVLVRPRFGLERPDVVAVHPEFGVCSIVVTGLRPGSAARGADGKLIVPEQQAYLAEQPHIDARRIADHLYDSYYADLDDPGDRHDHVRSLLIAPLFDDAIARATFAQRGEADGDVARCVWGKGFLTSVEAALSARPAIAPAIPVAPANASGIQRLLDGAFAEPAPKPLGVPARLNPVARSLVDNPTNTKLRRVRGPGGSGKTFALTARAAALAAASKRVCVMSFTTTMGERLAGLVSDRCAELGADARLVTITSFHELAEHTVLVAEAAGYRSIWPEGARWPAAIVDRATQVIGQGFDYRYDAILIDEGQDFSVDWWTMVRSNYLADDGEMVLAVDQSQNLYSVEPWFSDEAMAQLGFTEPWIELGTPVRTPTDLVAALGVVGVRRSNFDPGKAAVVRQELLGTPVPTVRRWVDIDRVADLGRQIGREVVRLVRDHPNLSPSDVVFLCDYHHDGLAAVREIERAGIPVHHQFSRDPAGRGVRRRRFSDTTSAVKGATVHGFKGRETSALVMGIGADATSLALASIAIERAGSPADGSPAIVTVVNGDLGRRSPGAALRWDDDPADVPITPGPPPAPVASRLAPPASAPIAPAVSAELAPPSPVPAPGPAPAPLPAPAPAVASSLEPTPPAAAPISRSQPASMLAPPSVPLTAPAPGDLGGAPPPPTPPLPPPPPGG